MAKTLSFRINDDLYLTQKPLGAPSGKKLKSVATNVVAIVDISGSMSSSLDALKSQLRAFVTHTNCPNSTFTLIAFSGHGQTYLVLDHEALASLEDRERVNRAIDRWLRPVGLTGFLEPLELARNLIAADKSKDIGAAHSLIFLTDGMDNSCSRAEIMASAESLAKYVEKAAVIAYGYYVDTSFLCSISETLGAQMVASNDISAVALELTNFMGRKVAGNRIEFPVGSTLNNVAWSADKEGRITAYTVDDGYVYVGPDVKEVFFLSSSPVGEKMGDIFTHNARHTRVSAVNGGLYGAIRLFALRMDANIVNPLLRASGDVALIRAYDSCFGQQSVTEFAELARICPRMAGVKADAMPDANAATILDVLRILEETGAEISLSRENFRYNRIGRATADANTRLTEDEQQEFATLKARFEHERDVKVLQDIASRMVVLSSKPDPIHFKENLGEDDKFYPISALTLNEDRPNVSILVKKLGKVDLSSRQDMPEGVPPVIETHIWRNYTIIRDGFVNVKQITVKPGKETLRLLDEAGLADEIAYSASRSGLVTIYLSAIPVVNRDKIRKVSARALAELSWTMYTQQVRVKILKGLLQLERAGGDVATLNPPSTYESTYGAANALWLKHVGITDNGFNPPRLVEPPTDVYTAKRLKVAIRNYSTVPSVSDWIKQSGKGKLTPSVKVAESVAVEATTMRQQLNSTEPYQAWLELSLSSAEKEVRRIRTEICQMKAGILLGNTWFSDLEPGTSKASYTIDGAELEVDFRLETFEEKI